MTDTTTQLREASAPIRERAAQAAWDFERIGDHERVIEVRQHPDGTDSGIIAVPTSSGVAPHIALWDPANAVAVADLLDAVADARALDNSMIYWKAATVAKLLGVDRGHGESAPSARSAARTCTCGSTAR